MRETQLSQIVKTEDPQSIMEEVRTIVVMMFPEFDFETVNSVFKDITRLFHGEYPGYRKCNTEYHNLNHTTDIFLTMARLMHGVFLGGETLTGKNVNLGLTCALMHDTGYVQTLDDEGGTGAKYTRLDTKRSMVFMKKYIADTGLPKEKFRHYAQILKGTSLGIKTSEIPFRSREIELLSKMLGTADLMGQMADRIYLEKLLFLFYEFREGAVAGYDTEMELLKKTADFYAMTLKRIANELGGMNKYMRYHFKARFDLDRDLYAEAVKKNMTYLSHILEKYMKAYRDHLRRGGVVTALKEKGK